VSRRLKCISLRLDSIRSVGSCLSTSFVQMAMMISRYLVRLKTWHSRHTICHPPTHLTSTMGSNRTPAWSCRMRRTWAMPPFPYSWFSL
jgi:hypothetical protein